MKTIQNDFVKEHKKRAETIDFTRKSSFQLFLI